MPDNKKNSKRKPKGGMQPHVKSKAQPLHARLRSALRQVWLYSPERRAALKRAHVKGHFHRCEHCQRQTERPEVDHIIAVGATPGSRKAGPLDSWDTMITKLFCPVEGLQILCHECHMAKKATGADEAVEDEEKAAS